MIITVEKSNTYVLNLTQLMRTKLAAIERGISHNENSLTIYDVPDVHAAPIQVWFDGYLALSPIVSDASIPADGTTESIITCAGLASFNATIWRNNQIVESWNDVLVADGSLEFSTNMPGTYVIGVRDGNNTGFTTLEVTEVA